MILSNSPLMAFVATNDSDRAKDFYTRILGLRLIADEDFALVFDVQGTMLRVQKVASFQPQPFTALGWQVDDIDTAIVELHAQGIEMMRVPGLPQDEVGIWTAGDQTRIAWFHDPDGNLLSLSEFPREAATQEPAAEEYNVDKVDEVALALLYFSVGDYRPWKGMDWSISNRLYEKGWIENPRNKNKSFVLTEAGRAACIRFFNQHFGKG